MKSLKQNLSKLADESALAVFGVFEKIRDVIPEQMIDQSKNEIIDRAFQSNEQFIDNEYPPTMENLKLLKRENMKYISWFSIQDFFGDQKFCLFNNIRLRS